MAGKKRKRRKKGGGLTRRSRYVGVSWRERDQKWRVRMEVAGVSQHLGCFDDEADGARAYDAAVAEQNLPFPRNFPGDSGAKQAKKADKRNNRSVIPDKGKSRFIGVSWDKKAKKWHVTTSIKGKNKFVGLYDDETAAARAYDAYVTPNSIGKSLNFPGAPAAARHRPGSSRYCGVSWNKRRKKWRAEITVNGKSTYLGCFTDEDDAGRAYDAAIRKYYPDEKPQKWKGYNFTAADGEEGSDDGDDVGSARGASSSSAAAIDESEEDEDEDASSSSEERSRRRRRWKTPTEHEAPVDNKALFNAFLRGANLSTLTAMRLQRYSWS